MPVPTWSPSLPNARDLAADRDWWRTLATRLLWDAARRSNLEAVCVRYGVPVGAVRAEPVARDTQEAAVAALIPFRPLRTVNDPNEPHRAASEAEYAI